VVQPPSDINKVIDEAWQAAKSVPGYLLENEARFLGFMAACSPAKGVIVEIGSFKGRSTVMLAKVAGHYGLGPIIAIDPHTHNLSLAHQGTPLPSTYDEFQSSLRTAGVSEHVEVHRAFSTDISSTWDRDIRFLWIDGDHTYEGAKADFDGFSRFVALNGVVALHDALNNFPGPIRVFVEEILRPNRFAATGCVHSIAWGQYSPANASKYAESHQRLERRVSRLIPFVQSGQQLHGMKKKRFKLNRWFVPQTVVSSRNLSGLLLAEQAPTD
jgi:predicted O-methyltransferase YrrM